MRALFWIFINGLGICGLGCVAYSSQLDEYLGTKGMPLIHQVTEYPHKRYRRLIIPRQDLPAPISLTQSYDFPVPTQQAMAKPQRKGNRNGKKKGVSLGNGNDDTMKTLTPGEKKLKKQNKSKKMHSDYFRMGQSPRRLRQHMQHKKKVKQFLQKRIQEQIKQRNPNPTFYS